MSLLAVGVSHQTAPLTLLEQLAMGADDAVKALHELAGSAHVSEAIVLATCNRVEVFAEVDRFHGGVTDISRVLARQAAATVEELSPYLTVHHEDQAVRHLFTVAAGLDSMVLGEAQVLGQLRNAYAVARQERTVGRALHPVAQRALRVGKRVHTETGIDRAGASLVSVCLDRAENRIGSLQGRPVLVLGAGSMGALAATTLARRGAAVTVSSRTTAHAQRLAATVEGRAADLADLPQELTATDVLVTCTGARGLVLGTETVTHAMTGRPDHPMVVIDLALPRDVDPTVATLPGVHLVDLALLQEKQTATGQGTVAAEDFTAAHALIEVETALLRAERQAAAVAPTVSALRSQAAEVVDAELLRLSTRLPDLDARARNEVTRTVRRVVDKLLHQPTVRVKELAGTPGGLDHAAALRALFGLDIATHPDSLSLAPTVTVDPNDLGPGRRSAPARGGGSPQYARSGRPRSPVHHGGNVNTRMSRVAPNDPDHWRRQVTAAAALMTMPAETSLPYIECSTAVCDVVGVLGGPVAVGGCAVPPHASRGQAGQGLCGVRVPGCCGARPPGGRSQTGPEFGVGYGLDAAQGHLHGVGALGHRIGRWMEAPLAQYAAAGGGARRGRPVSGQPKAESPGQQAIGGQPLLERGQPLVALQSPAHCGDGVAME